MFTYPANLLILLIYPYGSRIYNIYCNIFIRNDLQNKQRTNSFNYFEREPTAITHSRAPELILQNQTHRKFVVVSLISFTKC